MTGRVEVGLLGPLVLRVDGQEVSVASQQQRALLARLSLTPNTVVTASELVDTLWIDEPPANAAGNLHSYLSRLRRLIGGARIVHEHGGYRLDVDVDDVDVGRVEHLATQAHAIVDPAAEIEMLVTALSAWRGEPLADLADLLAFAAERARLSALRRQLHRRVMELRVASGDAAGVLPDLEAAATGDPLDEHVHLLLVSAVHQLGRTSEALRIASQLRHRLVETSGLDPSPALAQLEQRILADDPTLRPVRCSGRGRDDLSTAADIPTAVRPTYVTPLYGRRRVLDHLEGLLDSEQLVTVTGPGGAGKTRLAVAVAQRAAAANQDVHYLPLVSLPTTTTRLVDVLAGVLSLRVESSSTSLAAIHERLASSHQLLVIDNCEHVLAAVRDLVDALLVRPSDLTILTTSRRPLGLPGEYVVRIGPLDDPPGDGDRDQEPSLRLFLERARRVRPAWHPDPTELDTVRSIIARLGALPLAIELAAGRLSSFSVTDLAARLDHALDLLADGRPTETARQGSLRATLEWSYHLLRDSEQQLLRHLSVFSDGADLDAVELLGSGLGLATGGTSELAALVESSMVDAHLDHSARYEMSEPVRAFAHEQLEAHTEHDIAIGLLSEWARHTSIGIDRDGRGPDELSADRRVRRELRNLRAAHRATLDGGDLDTAIAISTSLTRTATFRDLPEIWSWALDLAEHPNLAIHPGRADALGAAAEAAWLNGDLDRAERLAREGLRHDDGCVACQHALASVQLFRGEPLQAHQLWAQASEHDGSYLGQAGLAAAYAGEPESARTLLERARRWSTEHGAPTDVAVYHYATGELLAPAPEAVEHYKLAVSLAHSVGSTFVAGIATVGLASAHAAHGRLDDALDAYERVVRYWQRTGNWTQQWTTLRNLAVLLAELGQTATAGLLVGAAARAPAAATTRQPADPASSEAASGMPRTQVVAAALRAIADARSNH